MHLSLFCLNLSSASQFYHSNFPLVFFTVHLFAFSLFGVKIPAASKIENSSSVIGIRYASPSFPPPPLSLLHLQREESCCCQMLRLLATRLACLFKDYLNTSHVPTHPGIWCKLVMEIPTGSILLNIFVLFYFLVTSCSRLFITREVGIRSTVI